MKHMVCRWDRERHVVNAPAPKLEVQLDRRLRVLCWTNFVIASRTTNKKKSGCCRSLQPSLGGAVRFTVGRHRRQSSPSRQWVQPTSRGSQQWTLSSLLFSPLSSPNWTGTSSFHSLLSSLRGVLVVWVGTTQYICQGPSPLDHVEPSVTFSHILCQCSHRQVLGLLVIKSNRRFLDLLGNLIGNI